MLSLRTADAFLVVAFLPLYFSEGEKRRPEMRLLFAGYFMLGTKYSGDTSSTSYLSFVCQHLSR